MSDPSNAGPYTVGVDGTLAPDIPEEIRFGEVSAGPGGKEGYLRKVFGERGGLDYVFVINSSSELIQVDTKSGTSFVPEATSQPLTNGPFRSVTITNIGGANVNTNDTDSVKVVTGNNNRDSGAPEFTARKFVKDVIPGL